MPGNKAYASRPGNEPDSNVSLSKLMKDAPITREQHVEKMIKRGDVRRRVEDLLLAKAAAEPW